jgi:DNA primase small subunit
MTRKSAYYTGAAFPLADLLRMLRRGKSANAMARRELALTNGKGRMYRYGFYPDTACFDEVARSYRPHRVDVGAEYTVDARLRKADEEREVLWRELVFDLDLTDYDDVRRCDCREQKMICLDCWTLMRAGMEILREVLGEALGYTKLLWVFSGRRGIHCWVGDAGAGLLSREARRRVLDVLQFEHRPPCTREATDALLRKWWVVWGGRKNASVQTMAKTLWPRPDRAVTIDPKHLLKAPFSLHPATGRVCIPFADPATFTPLEVPDYRDCARDPDQRRWMRRARGVLRQFADSL